MRIGSELTHNRWHPGLEPIARVAPGEEITLETRDGLDGQLDRSSTAADLANVRFGRSHPLTGPVYVEGAEPGDLLEVEILGYEVPDYGITAFVPGVGFLADVFDYPYLVVWEIDDGFARTPALPGVAIPADPFAGVLGVAPSLASMERMRAREEGLGAPDASRGRAWPAGGGGRRSARSRRARTAATSTSASSSPARSSSCRSTSRARSSRPATCTTRRATARCASARSRSPVP